MTTATHELNMTGACYKCRHRGTLPGNCHSKCCHPSAAAAAKAAGPLAEAMSIFAGVGRAPAVQSPDAIIDLQIQAEPHGVLSGWFMFPWNFDPTWLRHCAGFETADGKNWEQYKQDEADCQDQED